MSKFPLDRRDFLKTSVAGAILTGAGIQAVAGAEATDEDPIVYVGSNENTLYAINANTGNEVWSFTEPSESIYLSSPTVVDGVVYVGSSDSILYAVDAKSGDEIWSFTNPSGGISSSPTIVDGVAYVGSSDSSLYAVDTGTGTEEWSFTQPSGEIISSPNVVDGVAYVGSSDSTLYAVDTATGTEEWSFTKLSGEINSSPIVADGTVFIGANDGTLYAVDTDTKNERWSFTKPSDAIRSSPAVVNETVYFGSNEGVLYALDITTGDELWSFTKPSGVIRSSPTIIDGILYVGSGQGSGGFNQNGSVWAIDAENGDQIWRFNSPSERVQSSPTVFDGTVYVGAQNNSLYAIDTETGDQEWQFGVDGSITNGVHSSPTVVTDPVNGDSAGSRIRQGTLGHDNTWADKQAGSEPDSLPAQNGLAINRGVAYIVSASRDGEIQQIDLEERTVIDSFDAPEGSRARGLTYGDGSLWFADGIDSDFDGEILELNPNTGEIWSRIDTVYDPRGLAFGEGSLWVVDITTNDIVEYAPGGTELGEFDIQGRTGTTTPRGLAYFEGSLWVGTIDGFLYKFSTGGSLQETTGERDATYGGLATTSTELLGPDEDGNLTVLRTLGEGDTPDVEARFAFEPESPNIGDTVTFDAGDSSPADAIQEYRWDFTGDGETDATGVTVDRVFEDPEERTVRLTIFDADGNEASTEKSIEPESSELEKLRTEILRLAEFVDKAAVAPVDHRRRAKEIITEIEESVDSGDLTAGVGEEALQRMVYIEEIQEDFLRGVSDAEYDDDSREIELVDSTAILTLKMIIKTLLIKYVAAKIIAKKFALSSVGEYLLEKSLGLVTDAVELLIKHLVGDISEAEGPSEEIESTADERARSIVEDLESGVFDTVSELDDGYDTAVETTEDGAGDALQVLIDGITGGYAMGDMEASFKSEVIESQGIQGTESGAKAGRDEALPNMDATFTSAKDNFETIEEELETVQTVEELYRIYEETRNIEDLSPIERAKLGAANLRVLGALTRDIIGLILDSIKGLTVGFPSMLVADKWRTRGVSSAIKGEDRVNLFK